MRVYLHKVYCAFSGIVAVLLLSGVLSQGCAGLGLATDISREIDTPVNVNLSAVTFQREKEPVPIRVRVADPGHVYEFPHRTTGSQYVTGTMVYKMRLGEGLNAAAPLVWNRYLSVQEGNQPGLYTIEMAVTDVSGELVQDLSGVSAFKRVSRLTGHFSLTLRCRLLDPQGNMVRDFASPQRRNINTTDLDGMAELVQIDKLVVDGFNEILPKFFADQTWLAALRQGGTGPAVRPPVAAAQAPPSYTPPVPPSPPPAIPPVQSYGAIGQRWAVVVGVSKYRDSRIQRLRYAAADAEAFHRWLISPSGGRYAPANVRLLLDEKATAANMRKALFEWLQQPLAEDVVTIFFAGHGSPESPDNPNNLYLLPHDAQYDSVAASSFPMWDIETALKRYIKARKVVVIADACHAGGVGHGYDLARRDNRGIAGVAVQAVSHGLESLSNVADGVCVISASSQSQLSREGQQWGGGHGVFTHFLLTGLQGEADYNRDGRVTVGEVTTYVSEKVRRETNSAQSPIVAGRYDLALTIAQ